MRVVQTVLVIWLAVFTGCSDPIAKPTKNSGTKESNSSASIGKQMSDSKPWRTDAAISEKFHPDFPDELQVIVHEGGPRLTERQPELVWVRITEKYGNAYRGKLLNQPQQLPSLKQGDLILFLAPNSENQPFMVTDKYLQERSEWHIGPCDKCGMPDLFDAPSDLQATVFPDVPADAKMEAFTSFCPLCGGVQMVSTEPIED